jgi:tetratricopeptide (TPR) repeat protein
MIPLAQRSRKHQLAAEWIAELGRPGDHAELIAHHSFRALEFATVVGQPIDELAEGARRAADAAGDRAASLGAFDVAAGHYEHALELWPHDDAGRSLLLLRHAKAMFLGGADDAIGDTLDRARTALLGAGDVGGAAQAELMLGELAYDQGNGAQALDHFRRAAALVADQPTSRAKAETYIANGVYLALFDQPRASDYAEAGLAMAEELNAVDLQATALDRLAVVRLSQGEAEESLRRAEQGIALSEGTVSLAAVRATGNLASLLGDLGQLARSRQMTERCVRIATTIGARRDVRWANAERVVGLYRDGAWEQAWRSLEDNLEAAVAAPYWMDTQCLTVRARIQHARGHVPSALADTRTILDTARDHHSGQVLVAALALRARFCANSEPHTATALVDEALGAIAGRRWIWNPACLVDLAHTARALNRGDELSAATARAQPTPWLDAANAIAKGAYAGAAETLARIGSRPDEAVARLRAAEQLLAEGERSEADGQLGPALELWRRVDATSYLQEANAVRSRIAPEGG